MTPGAAAVTPPGDAVKKTPGVVAKTPAKKLACAAAAKPPGLVAKKQPGVSAVKPPGVVVAKPPDVVAKKPPGVAAVKPPGVVAHEPGAAAAKPPDAAAMQSPGAAAAKATDAAAVKPYDATAMKPPSVADSDTIRCGGSEATGSDAAELQECKHSVIFPCQFTLKKKSPSVGPVVRTSPHWRTRLLSVLLFVSATLATHSTLAMSLTPNPASDDGTFACHRRVVGTTPHVFAWSHVYLSVPSRSQGYEVVGCSSSCAGM